MIAHPSRLVVLLSLTACAPPSPVAPVEAPPPLAASDDALRPTGKLSYAPGPLKTRVAEYQFAAGVDAEVLGDRATEVWAVVHMPDPLPAGKAPLLVFLHGNHGTCGTGSNPRQDSGEDYTNTGVCPEGFVVTPNHRGYDYIGQRLASWGYVVVSVNANRGITAGAGTDGDDGLNLARGRLVLRHLARLNAWSSGAEATPDSLGVDLSDRLDFSQVGLMGHSRGGEGVRAALQQYRDADSIWPAQIPTLAVRAILEIGPVDGQTSRVLTPHGTAWGVIAPGCDGDVSDLEGLNVFERMRDATVSDDRPKMAVVIWGANHNFFNTEWQTSDAWVGGCPVQHPLFVDETSQVGSARQQQAGLIASVSFFRAFVGAESKGDTAAVWNSDFALQPEVDALTRFERGFEYRGDLAGSTSVNALDAPEGITATGTTLTPTSKRARALRLTPTEAAGTVDIAVPDTARAAAEAFRSVAIGFRAGRERIIKTADSAIDVQLLDAAGTVLGSAPLSDYIEIGPGQSSYLLASARIQLSEFAPTPIDVSTIATIRFAWESPSSIPLLVSDLRFFDAQGLPTPEAKPALVPPLSFQEVTAEPIVHDAALATENRVITETPFGFRAAKHTVHVDGETIATARVVVDNTGARIVGDIPDGDLEIHYGAQEIWRIAR